MKKPKYLTFANHQDGHAEDLVLLIDRSHSQGYTDLRPSRLAAGKKAVEALLKIKHDSYPHDRVGIVTFCGKADVVHELANVREHLGSLEQAVQGIITGDSTNISNGLKKASELLGQHGRRGFIGTFITKLFVETSSETPARDNRPRRKRIILLSDGEQNVGWVEPDKAAVYLKPAITIDVVGIGGSRDADGFDEPTLKGISSGAGHYVFIKDASALIKKFESLGHRLTKLEE